MIDPWRSIAWWIGILVCYAALAVGAFTFYSRQVLAYGALAVGLPENVAREGVAFGWALNYASKDAAREKALEHCRTFQKSEAAVASCKVVETFADECLAVALDQEPGTRGVGWGVRPSLDAARADAMTKCAGTATPTRERSCEIVVNRCDGRK